MGDTLEALHRLQAVERQLATFRRDRESLERRVVYHKRQAEEAEQKLKERHDTTRERQVKLDALQLDVTAREESVDHHRQALNTAKTNKEYAAILTAMNTEKADNSKLETEILRLMDAVQELQDDTSNLEAARAELLEDVAGAEKALGTYEAESRRQFEGLRDDREQCAEKVPPSALATFNRVAGHHDGEALVPVCKLHPKREEYGCSGCNMQVTLEIVNTLHTRDDIQICRVCGRILFLETPAAQRGRA